MHYGALILPVIWCGSNEKTRTAGIFDVRRAFYGFSLSTMAMTMTVQAAALNNALRLSRISVR